MAAASGEIKTSECAFCKKSSAQLHRCKKCCLVFYCGPDCQKKDWARGHKETCVAFEPPLVFVPPTVVPSVAALKCGFCKQIFEKLYACKKCSLVAYCGKDCQRQDWKRGHRETCRDESISMTLKFHDSTLGETMAVDRVGLLGEDSYVCMKKFNAATADERHALIKKVAKDSKSARKRTSGMNDVTQRWAAAFATSRLVILCMTNNEFVPARTHLNEFFRLWKLFEVLECTEEQRDTWQTDCHFACMQKNQCVLDLMLLDAENLDTRLRVYKLPKGPDKTKQAYDLVTSIEASQALHTSLGEDFKSINFGGRIFMVFASLYILLEIGCDTANGIIFEKSFGMLDRQMAFCQEMLQNTDIIYDLRDEDKERWLRLEDIIGRMKQCVRETGGM